MDRRKCTGCGIAKPITEFGFANSHGNRKRRAQCQRCHLENRRRHYRENADRLKSDGREYYAANREARKSYRRRRYRDDPANYKAAVKKNLATPAGRAKYRARMRRYSSARWSKGESERNKLRARQFVCLALQGGILIRPDECSNCGSPGQPEAHHHKGYEGKNWLNVKWLCRDCHVKADRLIASRTA